MRKTLLLAAALVAAPLAAQTSRTYTAADYDRAARMLAPALNGLVVGGTAQATWLPDERFWYRTTTLNGAVVVVVDPARRTRTQCEATVATCGGVTIPATGAAAGAGGRGGRGGAPGAAAVRGARGEPAVLSPDGTKAAFIRDWNLWMIDVASRQESALTTDGVENFGYATDNAGWTTSNNAILKWSPDSRRIATQQQDERTVAQR